jgi:predicted aldo/keto reductase-like oxidoreductase
MLKKEISRRGFLGGAISSTLAAGLMGADRASGRNGEKFQAAPKIRDFRTLGRTGAKVSDISFGAGDLTNANVLAAALDRGINYIDTAEHYMRGASERAIGEVLKTRGRKSVFLTTKLNLKMGGAATKPNIRDRFMKCLERLQTDRADCLMIHMCTLEQVKHEPYHELIGELKAEGKVRFSGLSNHGADYSLHGALTDPMDEVVLAAAEDGRFDIVLFTFNFIKTDMGERILRACKAKGMGTTLMKMNPVKSGEYEKQVLQSYEERFKKLNRELPDSIKKLRTYTDERETKTAAFLKEHGLAGAEQVRDAAIKFCLSHPDVHCLCPTINSFEDLDAFTALSGTKLTGSETSLLADYQDIYGPFYCRHACGACEPACPEGVPVNTIMRYDHYFRGQGREKTAMEQYAALGEHNASSCPECAGPCERACPYGVPIQGLLTLAHETLTLP